MEYTPINIALKGESQGEYSMATLGPYDYWANRVRVPAAPA